MIIEIKIEFIRFLILVAYSTVLLLDVMYVLNFGKMDFGLGILGAGLLPAATFLAGVFAIML